MRDIAGILRERFERAANALGTAERLGRCLAFGCVATADLLASSLWVIAELIMQEVASSSAGQ
ncbi:hypothetical protein D3C76_1350100 [compost metagenome]